MSSESRSQKHSIYLPQCNLDMDNPVHNRRFPRNTEIHYASDDVSHILRRETGA